MTINWQRAPSALSILLICNVLVCTTCTLLFIFFFKLNAFFSVILVHFHSSCSYAIGSDSLSSYTHAQTLESVCASVSAHASSKTAVKTCDNPSELQLTKSSQAARYNPVYFNLLGEVKLGRIKT